MHITKPDDVMLLQGFEKRGDQCYLIATVGYVVEADGRLLSEKDAWQWLAPLFPDEPFDIGLQKRRGTYGVVGAAYAPAGQSVARMALRVRFGKHEKTLHVHGDRLWQQGMTGWYSSKPVPFTHMPVDLAHAMGGADDATNPYGKGLAPEGVDHTGVALPNIEGPDAPVLSIRDRPAMASLGNLPATHPSLAAWAGTFDATWEKHRFPWLPDDVDPRYFDRVAQDQCDDTYWRGDEQWSVEGMHPELPLIKGVLPGLQPQLLWLSGVTSPWASLAVPVLQRAEFVLDTVWLFPDTGRQVLLYRAALPVQREDGADIEAVWINTFPAGVDIPNLAGQVAAWAKQTPEIAAQLAAASTQGAAAGAALAGVAAGIALTAGLGIASSAVRVNSNVGSIASDDPSTNDAQPLSAAEPPKLDTTDGVNPIVDQINLAEIPTAEALSADTGSWADALWSDICEGYRQAWDEARDVVRQMQKEQAAYGVVFPEVEPFVAPPMPGATSAQMTVPKDLAQQIARQVDEGLAEGQRMFEAVVRDSYPDSPQMVDDILARARTAADIQISDQQMEEVLSNLPPALRERADAETQALSSHFDELNQRLRDTFHTTTSASTAETVADTLDLTSAPVADFAAANATLPSATSASADIAGALGSTPAAGGAPAFEAAAAAAGAASAVSNSTGSLAEATTVATTAAAIAGTPRPLDMRGLTLENEDFRGAELSHADFAGAVLVGCDFTGAQLPNASFVEARIESCDFTDAKMAGVSLQDMDARDTVFANADWRGAQAQRMSLASCDLNGIDATAADFTLAQLDQCTLDNACLVQATLTTTTLSTVRAISADFSDVQAEGLRIDSGTTLEKASFQRAALPRCSFQKSAFPNSVWDDADVSHGMFLACDLTGMRAQRLQARATVFKDSLIRDADWQQANLMEASFDYAVLERVDASGSNLHGIQTRTASIRSMRVDGALLSASRLLQEHGNG